MAPNVAATASAAGAHILDAALHTAGATASAVPKLGGEVAHAGASLMARALFHLDNMRDTRGRSGPVDPHEMAHPLLAIKLAKLAYIDAPMADSGKAFALRMHHTTKAQQKMRFSEAEASFMAAAINMGVDVQCCRLLRVSTPFNTALNNVLRVYDAATGRRAALISSDTECYVCALSDGTCVISFRGTEPTKPGGSDIITDVWLHASKVNWEGDITNGVYLDPATGERYDDVRAHAGFQFSFKDVESSLLPTVESVMAAVGHKVPTRVLCCGHSLGGALATLCALRCALRFPDVRQMCVTIGSPFVGNRQFAALFDEKVPCSYRVMHDADPVPAIPLFYVSASASVAHPFHHVHGGIWVKGKAAGGETSSHSGGSSSSGSSSSGSGSSGGGSGSSGSSGGGRGASLGCFGRAKCPVVDGGSSVSSRVTAEWVESRRGVRVNVADHSAGGYVDAAKEYAGLAAQLGVATGV